MPGIVVVGADPGKSGAITIIDVDALTVSVFDMPIVPIGNGKRTEVSAPKLFDLLDPFNPTHFVCEDVWSNPNDGHVGAFSFGDTLGTLKGVFAAYSPELLRVRPGVWKKTLRVTADKATSIARAKELMPCMTPKLTLKKHDGRAESALIALFGTFSMGIRLTKPLTLRELQDDGTTAQ